jgi:hypothetical protein
MTDRICPIMSRPLAFSQFSGEIEVTGFVSCQREKCEAWKPKHINGGEYCVLIWRPAV